MPKSLFVDPVKMRAPGTLSFTDIPMNQYQKGIKEERANYSDEELLDMYTDMLTIRQFEIMLNSIKKQGVYCGREFSYPGPAHLSMGEESVAVGQAFLLDRNDYILGNHRSHHEVIAKAFSAIRKLSDTELMDIMKNFSEGKPLQAVEKSAQSAKTLAQNFFLYGAICELFAKANGFSHGLGGSMHAFFLPFGIYPNNAIVGGSAPIGVGIALFKKCNQKNGIVVANLGDGSVGCGPVWESLNFAAMDQFNQLWEKEYRGGLPLIFNFTNNSYGMGGQTCGETMAYRELVRIGAGISPTQLHAERVDGFNPLAVIDAYRRKKELLARGDGPCLLDIVSYRFSGHSPSDASSYRTQEEIAEWEKYDPVVTFADQLIAAKVTSKAKVEEIQQFTQKRIEEMFLLATDPQVSPHEDFKKHPDFVEKLMFSNLRVEKMEDRPCDVLTERAENSRIKQFEKKSRFALDADGTPLSKTRVYNVRDGIFEALLDKFYTDPTLIAYGEDLRDWGGPFAVYRGLTESLPYHRFFNSPISEAAMIGAGGRVRHGRRARGGGIDVQRFHRARRRRDFQPIGQMAGDERRLDQDAGGDPHFRGPEIWRAAFPGLVRHGRAHPRLEGGLPGHPLRRQGIDECGLDGHRSGALLREPAHVRYRRILPSRRGARWILRSTHRRTGHQANRQRPHHPEYRRHALPGSGSGADVGGKVSPVSRNHRRPQPGAL